MWTKIGKFLVLSSFLISSVMLSNQVWAEDVSFEATISADKVSLQDFVQLTLTVHGAKDVSTVPAPSIDGFEARYLGPQTSWTVVNGVTSSEHTFLYNLFPSKVGAFEIPPITITVDGKSYSTSTIKIEVVDNPKTDAAGTTTTDTRTIDDKVFMKVSLEAKEAYVGQKLPLTMKVYVSGLSLQLAAAPYLKPNGFTADKSASMQKDSEIINGMKYETMTFRANIYPTQIGDVEVGPLQAVGDLLYRTSPSSNDLLGSLFSNVESRPITLHAPAIALHVLDLPEENKPKDFSGGVGQYDFKASVGPNVVKLGDPLTLKMTVTGDGRLKDLVMPGLNDNRFKTYDPQIKDSDDSKTLEQVIIPTDPNITEVPAISFSYFDPSLKQYKTITQGPFSIRVSAPAKGEEFKAYGFVEKSKAPSEKNFSLQLDGVGRVAQNILERLKLTFKDWKFWLCMGLIFLAWVAWKIWQRFQAKLQNDKAFARKWQAESKAKEVLKAAKGYLQQDNSKEFYGSLYKAINDYLADHMHVPVASLSWGTIEEYLKSRSIDSSKLETIKEIFERAELVRFASASLPANQMSKDYSQVEDLLTYLPKILK